MSDSICHIIGAGENPGLFFSPEEQDLIIAADGGLTYLQDADIQPNIIIGDFDSLGWIPGTNDVITLPKEKDVTDTWAAVEIGLQRGYRHFRLYCCCGGRFDHTLANLQTVACLAERGMSCELYNGPQVITAISGGTVHFSPAHTGYISIFSHSDRCSGVTIEGLKYSLENAELTNSFPLGVSNEFMGTASSVTVKTGTAILVYNSL